MFFLRDLEQTISLHPSFFGPRVRDYLTNKLFQDAEGTCNGQYYIICVVDPYDISEGRVLPGIAKAEYTIRYRAVVWKPFRGEILDATVTSLNRMGFFADVGPLSVFVSNAMIPADIKWDPSATPPQYTNNSDQVIEKGTQLRLKIMGVRSDVANMYAVGTIKEDYLGYTLFNLEEIKETADDPSAFSEPPVYHQGWTYAPFALVAARGVACSRGADTLR